jgi:hypothetical protein
MLDPAAEFVSDKGVIGANPAEGNDVNDEVS